MHVTDLTEAAVVRRVPSIAEERLGVLSRRQPVTVPPGHLAGRVPAGDPAQRDGRFGLRLRRRTAVFSGVLTERDIFGRIVGGPVDLSQPVEIADDRPIRKTLDLDQTIRDAIVLMQTGRYRNVPLVDADGQLVGVVRQSDIINYLAESFPEELLNLPPRPHQRMKEPEGA